MKVNNPTAKAKEEIKIKKILEKWKSVFPEYFLENSKLQAIITYTLPIK